MHGSSITCPIRVNNVVRRKAEKTMLKQLPSERIKVRHER